MRDASAQPPLSFHAFKSSTRRVFQEVPTTFGGKLAETCMLARRWQEEGFIITGFIVGWILWTHMKVNSAVNTGRVAAQRHLCWHMR